MKEEARHTSQQTREEINQAVKVTKEKGKQLVGEAKQEASKMAEQQQQNVAHHMDSISDELTKIADNLDKDQTWVASGARQTAQVLDKMSKSLRERDFNTVVTGHRALYSRATGARTRYCRHCRFFLSRF